MGFRDGWLGFGFRFGVWGLGLGAWGLVFDVGFRIWGLGFRVWDQVDDGSVGEGGVVRALEPSEGCGLGFRV